MFKFVLGGRIKELELSSPREARAFHELRRYHTRPLQLNWGPENVHLEKRDFGTQIAMLGF